MILASCGGVRSTVFFLLTWLIVLQYIKTTVRLDSDIADTNSELCRLPYHNTVGTILRDIHNLLAHKGNRMTVAYDDNAFM